MDLHSQPLSLTVSEARVVPADGVSTEESAWRQKDGIAELRLRDRLSGISLCLGMGRLVSAQIKAI